jgi:hypothetical protein
MGTNFRLEGKKIPSSVPHQIKYRSMAVPSHRDASAAVYGWGWGSGIFRAV